MEERRFFTDAPFGWENATVSGGDFRHMRDVLRLRPGDKAILLDGSGRQAEAELIGIERECAEFKILNTRLSETEPHVKITLFQSVIKGDKTALVVQKAVELGVSEIIPFISRYTVKTGDVTERLNKVAAEAVKQCGRAIRVNVQKVRVFQEMLRLLEGYDAVLFCNERENDMTMKQAIRGKRFESVALIVGCEGGFSEEEEAILKAKSVSVTLGKRILRAETAAISAISNLVYECE